jgi:hypothetical protein
MTHYHHPRRLDQQLDLDGNLHDIAPRHDQPTLFTADPQIPGQTALDTDACPTNNGTDDVNSTANVAARRAMFSSFGWNVT